jgi:hypothetical protein
MHLAELQVEGDRHDRHSRFIHSESVVCTTRAGTPASGVCAAVALGKDVCVGSVSTGAVLHARPRSLHHGAGSEIFGLVSLGHLDLTESVHLGSDIEGVTGSYVGQSDVVRDLFQTRNQLYGANLGLGTALHLGGRSLRRSASSLAKT